MNDYKIRNRVARARSAAGQKRDAKRVIENSIEVLQAQAAEIKGAIANQRRKLKEITDD